MYITIIIHTNSLGAPAGRRPDPPRPADLGGRIISCYTT